MAGFNPNRKKKTYSFNRSQAPSIVSSSLHGHIEYYDETLVAINNPFYILNTPNSQGAIPIPPPPPPVLAEYDENVVNFSWEDTRTANFDFTFSSIPIVTLEILPSGGFENIIAFLSDITTTNAVINLSAPYSGGVVFRAIYSPSYPAVVSRSYISSSYFYTASAGFTDLINQDSFNASYSLLSASINPTNIFVTTRDINNNGDADVAVVDSGSYGLLSTAISLSAPITNRVNYLAIK